MRWFRIFACATGATVTLAACGGGGSAAVGDPPLPSLTSTTPTPSPSMPSSHAPRHHSRSAAASPTATSTPTPRSSSHAASQPASTTTTSPASRTSPTRSSSPSHHPSPTATSSCAGVSGSTTTIQEQAGDKFVPSTVAISRCDSVKAVYSDTTGTPHTFTGPGWDSGGMSSTGKTSYTYRFASTGTFNFYCTYHKSLGMTGTITVS